MGKVVEMPSRENCEHEFKEEYYGWLCTKCKLFFAFGCAPWDYVEDGAEGFDGERENCEEDC